MKPLRFFQVDAFTDKPFGGNPAAVLVLDMPAHERWMQNIAMEMNLAETAFLHRTGKRDDDFALRWFTPVYEVDLCGHATLAAAHALWESGAIDRSKSPTFQTRSGELKAGCDGEWIELDFPATPPHAVDPAEQSTLRTTIEEALSAQPTSILRTAFDVFVELDSESRVRALTPNFARLRDAEARGVIVTAKSDGKPFDFISRFFAPLAGIDEDPVTGSAHCALAPYWSSKLNKTQMLAQQSSKRGGVVRVTLRGDRVLLGGQAVTVFQGELSDDAALGNT